MGLAADIIGGQPTTILRDGMLDKLNRGIYMAKQGSQLECSNYRPKSCIPHVVKVLERVVSIQLKEYLLLHNFITHDQSAYLKKHSTETAMHKVILDLLDNVNEGMLTGVCFLDLQKCFDTIDHTRLLFRLGKYGIQGNELKWFQTI